MTGPSSAVLDLREDHLAQEALRAVRDVQLYPGLDARGTRARLMRWQAEARRQDGVPAVAPSLR